ncbi:MAG: DinB family protein [Gemmatimonadales bacterium]
MRETVDFLASLSALLTRDLEALRRTIEAYPDDALPWHMPPGLPNSTGTLALHVAGNLRHFIGATLGATGYVRNREREFETRGLPRAELAAGLATTEVEVRNTLRHLNAADLQQAYPLPLAGHRFVTGDLMLHLVAHLSYHLGQADYHRRVVTGDATPIGAMALAGLASARPVDG